MAGEAPLKSYDFVETFQCLGAECADTCCRGWGMQLDAAHKALYESEAPELLDAVTSGEAETIMRRDPQTDFCVKFDHGLCGIHKQYGTRFLGDACHFYPRITRRFGGEAAMAAALSCPEITRKILYDAEPFARRDAIRERLPTELKNYLPEGMEARDATAIADAFVALAGDENASPERSMARVVTIAHSLKHVSPHQWPEGLPVWIRMADGRLPPPEPSSHDAYHLMQTFAALLHAAKRTSRLRLEETVEAMQTALGMVIDSHTLDVLMNRGEEDYPARREALWRNGAGEKLAPVLRRWLQGQIAMASFPFSGFGRTPEECAMILAVRFAFVRLALMCHLGPRGEVPDADTVIRVIQSIARFLDHLADPELSLKLYAQAGWQREARLRALAGDGP